MNYQTLHSLYYKDESKWNREYQSRFCNPFTRHFNIEIRQFKHRHSHSAFYCPTEEILLLQDCIMSEFVQFIGVLQAIPGVGIKQFLHSCLVEEIKSSNDIEGVRSTRKEIRLALAATPEERRKLRLGGIVSKYIKILNRESIPLSTCNDIRALYDELLSDEIRREDPSNLPDGKIFRKGSVDILAPSQKTVHRGIFPEEKIIRDMDAALGILPDQAIPFFVRIAVFHYLFGYIHPFYDGNGRTSRLITSYLLANYLHPAIALRLSIDLKKQHRQYYKLFSATDAEINKGDLTPFIIGTLQFIRASSIYTKEILTKRFARYKSYEKKLENLSISNQTLAGIYNILLQAAIFSDFGGATITEIKDTLQKSENTIKSRLKEIPNSHIIITKSSRPYHYRLNLEMFQI